jgi:hypothetical protein
MPTRRPTSTAGAVNDAILDLQTQPKVYAVFGTMIGALAVPFAVEALRGKHGAGGVLIGLACAALFTWVWLRAYRLRLTGRRLEYQSLFGGKHDLALSEIERAHVEYGVQRYSDRFRPTHRIVVTPTARSGKHSFCVNVAVFWPRDMRLVHERLAVEPLPES